MKSIRKIGDYLLYSAFVLTIIYFILLTLQMYVGE